MLIKLPMVKYFLLLSSNPNRPQRKNFRLAVFRIAASKQLWAEGRIELPTQGFSDTLGFLILT
jgi:hypothetical protein